MNIVAEDMGPSIGFIVGIPKQEKDIIANLLDAMVNIFKHILVKIFPTIHTFQIFPELLEIKKEK